MSTFLVYKVKKCLLKSGKVSTQDGLSETIKRSVCAHQVVTQGPSVGHRQNKWWALFARIAGVECPKFPVLFGHFVRLGGFDFMHDALWRFCNASMTILWCFDVFDDVFLWYFYPFYDTLMRLLVKKSEKYHSCILLYISYLPRGLTKKMILWDFFRKKLFSCAYKLDGKSKKVFDMTAYRCPQNYVPT